jgi:phosphonoacetaldehyde hydrolase
MDHGCLAPISAFQEVYREKGIEITFDQARAPMGRYKKDHIRAILEWNDDIAEKWKAIHGKNWNESDIEEMFESYKPIQLSVLERHDDVIDGALEVIDSLRQSGIKVVGTTGFFREAVEKYKKIAQKKGLEIDVYCPDDVSRGRPYPWMIFKHMEDTMVYPPCTVVKIGDTEIDMREGKNAGAWSIGVTNTSSLVGKSKEELQSLPERKKNELIGNTKRKLKNAGANFVIKSIKDLPRMIKKVNKLLASGKRP